MDQHAMWIEHGTAPKPARRVGDDDHDMDAWAQMAPDGKWHQVCGTRERGFVLFPCAVHVHAVDPADTLDYRWRPPSGERCQRPFCQIDPGP